MEPSGPIEASIGIVFSCESTTIVVVTVVTVVTVVEAVAIICMTVEHSIAQ